MIEVDNVLPGPYEVVTTVESVTSAQDVDVNVAEVASVAVVNSTTSQVYVTVDKQSVIEINVDEVDGVYVGQVKVGVM